MQRYSKSSIRAAFFLSASLIPSVAFAQDAAGPQDAQQSDDELTNQNVIIVTATRRETTVQDAPINISAIDGELAQELGITNLRELVRTVPGVYIPEQGARSGTPIVFRGLNATSLSSFDDDNSGGGTVATYVGDIPLYVDLRLHDIDRVEFLLGPQGTLYGAGTLGGAIRYIPNKPQFDAVSGEIRADVWDYDEGSGLSSNTGMTVNLPIAETLAFRASIDFINDQGFIDYPFAVQQPGVSNPNIDPSDPAAYAANLKRLSDVNTDETLTIHTALRFNPSDVFDATLNYYYQETRSDGRQFSQARLSNYPVAIGRYESALRVAEPTERQTQLVSLEAELDLGFATLVSATGYSTYDQIGQRDQTDLLIGLEYSYELFPTFTAFTEELGEEEQLTQELRLISQFEGPFSFIVGGFYSKRETSGQSSEFTPGYSEYLGGGRPDNLEYFSVSETDLTELAAFGEATFEITDQWQVTGGLRYYDYDLETISAVDFPLFRSVFNGDDPDSIVLDFEPGGQKDDGFLFKFNTSYKFTPDLLVYATVSEGYRIGNSNGVAPCPDPLPPNQIACALPNELFFAPDKTLNYELGFKSQFGNGAFTLNGALYYIEWDGPQVGAATQNGLIPITINGAGARSQGLELYGSAQITDALSVRATYSYVNAELTELSPNLLQETQPPGFGTVYIDGQEGDRLPGSPEHQGSLSIDYTVPLDDRWDITFGYSGYIQSNVLTRTGARAGGLTLPGFDTHQFQIRLESEDGWKAALYVDNAFNEYIETGVRGTPLVDQSVSDENGDPVYVRTYGTFVSPPRQIGLRFSKSF